MKFLAFSLIFLSCFSSLIITQNVPHSLDHHLQQKQFQFKISYIHDLIFNKGLNCTQIIDYFLERALAYNPKLNAIIAFNPNARAEALKLDLDRAKTTHARATVGKLHCIPTLIKDNIDVAGMATTGAIRAFRHSIPLVDALVVERLRREGAIVLAKANMVELAIGIVEDTEMGGLCNNPFDLRRSCSGSSSGSGAGVAAGLAVIGIGTDTSGSILGPASFQGLYGIRYGAGEVEAPLDGILPLLTRSDTVGPLTKHLDDMVLVLSVIWQMPSIYDR